MGKVINLEGIRKQREVDKANFTKKLVAERILGDNKPLFGDYYNEIKELFNLDLGINYNLRHNSKKLVAERILGEDMPLFGITK